MANLSSSRDPRGSASPIAVDVRTDGVRLGARLEALIIHRVQRRFARAGWVERAHVRLVDVNGPRGGLDIECRIELLLQGAPRVFVRKRAAAPPAAFSRALAAAQVALQRMVNGRGPGARGVEERVAREGPGAAPAGGRAGSGSLIGRREGRARSNLLRAADRPEKRRGDVPVDTAAPGRSATDRRAGYGSTARRNTKLRAPKAAVMLEDSMQDRPSRKSTRRSAGRNRPDNPLYLSKRRGLRVR